MEKSELEGLLENENSFVEYVQAFDQQKGEHVFDTFIIALLDLGNSMLLKQLLQIHASCVVGISSSLNLVSLGWEKTPEEKQELMTNADRKYQIALSMEAFMIRFYQFSIDKVNKPTLDLITSYSLETGNFWKQSSKMQNEISMFLQSCNRFLSPALSRHANVYLEEIEKQERREMLLPRDRAVFLCTVEDGPRTWPKGTTGVIISVDSKKGTAQFLVDNKQAGAPDFELTVQTRYLGELGKKKPDAMFVLTPFETKHIQHALEIILTGNHTNVANEILCMHDERLLEPLLYQGLLQNPKKLDQVLQHFLKNADPHAFGVVQNAFMKAAMQFAADSKAEFVISNIH